jgi:hypothetical protein
MRASRAAPDGYVPAGSVVLDGNVSLKRRLTVASLPLFVVAWLVLAAAAVALRPDLAEYRRTFRSPIDGALFSVWLLATLLAMTFVVIVVHEAVHGLALWLYTRSRPRFGYKGWYAYASAPGWYLSRNRFLVVLLSPLLAITAAALALVTVLPPVAATVVLFGAALNAGAALGDLYLCVRLLAAPASAVVEDRRDGIVWHVAAG